MSWAALAFAAVGVFLVARFVRSMNDVHALARGGHVHRLRALLDQDPALAKLRNAVGETPLHVAARHGEVEAVRLLLLRGADPNAKTPVGATPLHVARAFAEDAVVKVLVAAGAESAGEPAFVNLGDGDLVTATSADDPEMLHAVARAQEGLPKLRQLHREHPSAASVKLAFTTDAGSREHLWGAIVELGDSTVRARMKAKPATHDGDFALEQERPLADVEDWQVEMPDGTIRGGFGYAVIFARAKKDLGQLPPGLAEHEHRFVDHAAG